MPEVKPKPARSCTKQAAPAARAIDLLGAAEAMGELEDAVADLVNETCEDIQSWQCVQFIRMAEEHALPKFTTAMLGTDAEAAVSASKDLEALLLSCAADPDPRGVTADGRAAVNAAVDKLYAVLAQLGQGIAPTDRTPLRTWVIEPGHAPHAVLAEPAVIPDWVDGDAPDPNEWIATPVTTEPAASSAAIVAVPSDIEVECELERARVLLGILIDSAVNNADDPPQYVQERTIALADEALRHVVRANGGEA